MPNAEKASCEPTIEKSSMVDTLADSIIAATNSAGPTLHLEQRDAIRNAVASSGWRSGKSLDSLGADGQEAATVNNSLTVQTQGRLESLRQWADDNCPEGVAGMSDNVRWLLSYAEDMTQADLRKRMSDAITLLYTHGVITDKMRAHARRNL